MIHQMSLNFSLSRHSSVVTGASAFKFGSPLCHRGRFSSSLLRFQLLFQLFARIHFSISRTLNQRRSAERGGLRIDSGLPSSFAAGLLGSSGRGDSWTHQFYKPKKNTQHTGYPSLLYLYGNQFSISIGLGIFLGHKSLGILRVVDQIAWDVAA